METNRAVYMVVVDRAAHTGRVLPAGDEAPADGWASMIGQCGALGECHAVGTEPECTASLAEYLKCDAVERGTYCYAHNPGGIGQ